MNTLKKITIGALLIAFALLNTQIAEAQIGTYKRLEMGLALGATQNTGDLNNSPTLANTRLGVEAHLRYNFNTYFAGRAFIGVGSLVGSGEKSNIPNAQSIYSFKSKYYNFGAIFEYNFFNFRGIRESYQFSPYVFAGFGLANITISKYHESQLLTTEGTGFAPMIPFGVGVKKALTRRLNLGVEFQTIKLFTDKLDGLETEPDGGVNFPNYVGVNPKKDMAYFFNVSVAYRFITIKCPESSLDYAGEK